MSGADELEQLVADGANTDEIVQAISRRASVVFNSGGGHTAFMADLGRPPFDAEPVREIAQDAIDRSLEMKSPEEEPDILRRFELAQDEFWGAVGAGAQESAVGLGLRGRLPEEALLPDASRAERLGFQVGALIPDTPLMALGLLSGTTATAELGPAAIPIGTANAFAFPAIIRAMYVDKFVSGEVKGFRDYFERLTGILEETTKAWGLGFAVGTTRQALGPVLASHAPPAVAEAVTLTAEAGILAFGGAAFEKRWPEPKEFEDAAVIILGLRTTGAVTNRMVNRTKRKLYRTFIETGMTPEELTKLHQLDPSLFEDMGSLNVAIPRAIKSLRPEQVIETLFSDIRALGAEPNAALLSSDVSLRHRSGKPRPSELSDPQKRAAAMRLEENLRQIQEGRQREAEAAEAPAKPSEAEVRLAAERDAAGREEAEITRIAEREVAGEPPAGEGGVPAASESLLSRVSINEKPTILQRLKDKTNLVRDDGFNDIYTDFFNGIHPFSRALDQLAGGAPVEILKDFNRRVRLHAGQSGIALRAIEHEQVGFHTRQPIGPGLKTILEPVKDFVRLGNDPKTKHQDLFREYIISKSALEAEARGVKTGFDETQLQRAQRVADDPKLSALFEETRTELLQFQENALAYLRDSGAITEKSFNQMVEARQEYLPFHRVMEGQAKGNSLLRMIGSEREIVDPLESIIKNTYMFIRAADRVETMKTFIDFVEESGAAGRKFATKIPQKSKPIKLGMDEKLKLIRRAIDGETKFTAEQVRAIEDEFAIFRPDRMIAKNNQAIVVRDGKREVWEFDPEIQKAIEHMDTTDVGWMTKIAGGPARTLRAGAVLSPEFMARNPLRDTATAYIVSDNGFRFFVDSMWGAFQVAGKTDAYKAWLSSGGAMAELVAQDRMLAQAKLADVVRGERLHERTRNAAQHPIEKLRDMSALMEQATRVGEFGRATGLAPEGALRAAIGREGARKAGELSKAELLEAGFASREVSLDFAKIGARMRALNHMDAFLGAELNGTDKMIRALKDNPGRTMMRVTKSVILPAMLLRIANEGVEGFDEIPDWQKRLFFLVPIEVAPAELPEGFESMAAQPGAREIAWVRYPKPFDFGIIFSGLAERAVGEIISDDPQAFDEFLLSVGTDMLFNPIPTFATPMVEQFANRSLFTQRPLIPADTEGVLPELQAAHYSTPLAKLLGRAVAGIPGMERSSFASPAVIENYVRGWTGGLGVHGFNALSAALVAAGVVPPEPTTGRVAADWAIWKAFAVRYPSVSSQPIIDFYDDFNKIQTEKRSISHLENLRQFRLAQEMRRRFPESRVELSSFRDSMNLHATRIRMIRVTPDHLLPPDVKLHLIERHAVAMTREAKRGNRYLDRRREIMKEIEKELSEEVATQKAGGQGPQMTTRESVRLFLQENEQ